MSDPSDSPTRKFAPTVPIATSEQGLFGALEAELRRADEPLDCSALFDLPSIRQHARTANRVSDYLGNLWRKNLVLRLPAPRLAGTRARWLYVWKNKGPVIKPRVDRSQAIPFSSGMDAVLNWPRIEITEEGDTVLITMPTVTITIKQTRR